MDLVGTACFHARRWLVFFFFLNKKTEFIPFFSDISVKANFINRSVGFHLLKQEAPVLYE